MSIGDVAAPADHEDHDGGGVGAAAFADADEFAMWEASLPDHPLDDPAADDEPPEPAWLAVAHRESTWAGLSAATTGPVGRDALTLLAELDAADLAARAQAAGRADARRAYNGNTGAGGGSSAAAAVSPVAAARALLDGIVVAQRVVNHAQAVQQQLMAALSRPGVAVPMADLIDLTGDDPAAALADAFDKAAAKTAAKAATKTDAKAGAGDDTTHAADARVGSADSNRDPDALLSDRVWAGVLRDAAVRAASAEIGCALHLAPLTARLRCEQAIDMVDTLPATLAAQHSGDIDGFRAKLIAERTAVLPDHLRRRVETRVLRQASCRTAAAFRRMVDREVITADPAAAKKRCEQARADRAVSARRGEDDMGIFTAIVPAVDADTAFGVLDAVAKQLATSGHADGRTHDQLRADAFCDLFHTLADTGHVHLTGMCPGAAAGGVDSPGAAEAAGVAGTGGARRGRPDTATTGRGTTSTAPAGPALDATGTADAGFGPADGTPSAGCGLGARPLPSGPLGTPASVRRPVALNVYIDLTTLAGLNEKPGELSGFGAITADTARALAASADTIRAILIRPAGPGPDAEGAVQPARNLETRCGGRDLTSAAGPPGDVSRRVCGTILDAGRAVYRPPDATADCVTARDGTCQFPGCRAPANRCDLDHRQPFDAGGDTCPHNLDALCRPHHRLKTFTGWHATRDPDTDRLTWTSPLGRKHTTEPSHLLHDPLAINLPAGTPGSTGPAPDDEPPPF